LTLLRATLIEELWANLGRPNRDTTKNSYEITTAQMGSYLDNALLELYRFIPVRTLRFITTVKDQATYSVPATVRTLLEVYWPRTGFFATTFADQIYYYRLPGLGESDIWGLSVFNNPSLFNVATAKLKQMDRLTPVTMVLELPTNQVRLSPAPSSGGDQAWFMAGEQWDWTSIAEMDEFKRAIMLWGEHESLDSIESRRNKLSGIPRSGGTIDYGGALALKQTSEKKLEEFKKECLLLSKLWL